MYTLTELSVEELQANVYLNSINISWNPLPSPMDQALNKTYTLVVKSGSSNCFLNTSKPYIVFNTSETAPKCEAYNFSVTALYDTVGTTYTGDGCSVPSHLLNQMIPSELDIKTLESTLKYEVTKESISGILLVVSFKVGCKISFI